MRDVRGNLELRPGFGIGLVVLAALGLSGAGIVTAILVGDAPTVFAPIVGAIWTVSIILMAKTLHASRIALTSHEIVVRAPFTRQRRSRSRIAKVVHASIHAPRGGSQNLFLLDARGKLVIRVNIAYYKREDVNRLIKSLDVPSAPDFTGTGKEFAKTYPDMLPWAERHPYRLAFAIAGTILLVIAVAVLLVLLATES